MHNQNILINSLSMLILKLTTLSPNKKIMEYQSLWGNFGTDIAQTPKYAK